MTHVTQITLGTQVTLVTQATLVVTQVTLVADKARLFRMLKIVAMPLVYLPIDSLLDPDNLIDQSTTRHQKAH